MDCNTSRDTQRSEDIFRELTSLDSFFKTWAKFYDNEICVPTYGDNFVGGEDNSDATREMGKKFKEITSYKIIPHNFQTNSLENGQKAYVDMFVPTDLAQHLTAYINRYPGYVSFWQPVKDNYGVNGLFVTYDANEKQTRMTKQTGILLGDPFTVLGYGGKEIMGLIREWLNENVKIRFNKNNYSHVTVVDTMPSEKPDRILDVILTALRDN